MKLAQALIERADLKAQAEQLIARMKQNALVQEGDTPAEQVAELQKLYESTMGKLETLIVKINKTNAQQPQNGVSLAAQIAKRDCLKAKIAAYRALKEASLARQERYSSSEIRYLRTTDVAQIQALIDEYAKQYRLLDTQMQEQNWAIELVD